jgi:hypothetical protein
VVIIVTPGYDRCLIGADVGELALVAACYSLDLGTRIANLEWFVKASKKIIVNSKFLG